MSKKKLRTIIIILLIAVIAGSWLVNQKKSGNTAQETLAEAGSALGLVQNGTQLQVIEDDEPEAAQPAVNEAEEADEPEAQTAEADYVEYHFRSAKYLNQHFEKHGKPEMGFKSAEDYEKAASDVINNPKALTKVEKEDGDYVYYVEDTNEFVILSTDGYIRTYFNPSAGKAYYDRQ